MTGGRAERRRGAAGELLAEQEEAEAAMAGDGLRTGLLNASAEVASGSASVVGSDAAWRQQVAAAQQDGGDSAGGDVEAGGGGQVPPVLSPGFGALSASDRNGNGRAPLPAALDGGSRSGGGGSGGGGGGAAAAVADTWIQRAQGCVSRNVGPLLFLLVLSVVQGGVALWATRFPVRGCTDEITEVRVLTSTADPLPTLERFVPGAFVLGRFSPQNEADTAALLCVWMRVAPVTLVVVVGLHNRGAFRIGARTLPSACS